MYRQTECTPAASPAARFRLSSPCSLFIAAIHLIKLGVGNPVSSIQQFGRVCHSRNGDFVASPAAVAAPALLLMFF